MKAMPILRFLAGMVLLVLAGLATFAQTTSFTYQGELTDNAQPANGSYDFEFLLFDAAEGGTQLGDAVLRSGVVVTDGKFSVMLDFGTHFTGANRFLEIRVAPSPASGTRENLLATVLSPRQPVMTVPYAMKSIAADSAQTASDADSLGGVSSGQYVLTTDPRMTNPRPPTAGSGDYVQNSTNPQSSSNFNISGTGKAENFDANSQFDILGVRVLSIAGTSNLFLGSNAGRDNTGNDNTFAGRSAGIQNTTGSYNAFFGANAGLYSNGVSNSFFGSWAGHLNVGGNGNSFFGREAGFNNSEGSRNTFFGRNAGKANITGTSNTALGYGADLGAGDLNYATAIGSGAIVSLSNTIQLGRTDGSDTVLIPGPLSVSGSWGSQIDVTTQYNIGGSRVLSVEGISNLFVGRNAGLENTTGTDNTFIGRSAGRNNTTSSYNTVVGANAGANTGANNNSMFGAWSGTNTTGGGNSFFGSNSGFNTTTGIRNTFLGRLAGNANTTGSNLTMVGYGADVGNPDLSFATAVGSGAVVSTSNTIQLGRIDGSDTVYIPGTINAQTHYSIAGSKVLSAPNLSSVFLGRNAGDVNTGTSNTFAGYLAGQSNTSGSGNSFFGRGAGASNTSDNDNSFFGYLSGASSAGGIRNSFFGMSAGYGNTTGDLNVFLGGYAGEASTTGSSNTAVGYRAGDSNTTGSTNTFVGAGADAASGNLQNATAIGAGTIVTASNRIQLGKSNTSVAVYYFAPYADGEGGRVCFNNQGELTVCQTSLGQMSNIRPFESGTALIRQMRPVFFEEKSSGKTSIGLLATEVNEIEPLLVTYRNGEVEGVKYDRIGVVLVNVVKEQQKEIERLKGELEKYTEARKREYSEVNSLKEELRTLKDVVCALSGDTAVCQ